jgi:aminoglycoside phosphotransferase (APT) family kinase protein
MKGIHSVLKKLYGNKKPSEIFQITKGFSFEEKWKVTLQNKKSIFIKIYHLDKKEFAYEIYTHLQKFYNLHVPVQLPIQFVEIPEESICAQVLTWVEGKDGEEILPSFSNEEQYQCGIQAGKALQTLHTVVQEEMGETWKTYRLNKYKRYMNMIKEEGYIYSYLDKIDEFVEKYCHYLDNRPLHFLHDDFHPSNLLFENHHFTAVIDFDRFEFGDPYHDFHKMALFSRSISVPFSVGQIHGYFNGEPQNEFWIYYALYAALIIPSDIVWSHKVTPNNINEMWNRINQIVSDHQEFTSHVPTWYKESKLESWYLRKAERA